MSRASFLVRNATILPFTLNSDRSLDLEPCIADVLVEGDRITQVAPEMNSVKVLNLLWALPTLPFIE